MSDNRPRVTVDKPVNLSQLDREMGTPGLSAALDADDAVVEVVAPASVTQADLQAAVDAHEATFAPDPDEEMRDKLANFPTNGSPKDLADLLAGSDGGTRVPGRRP